MLLQDNWLEVLSFLCWWDAVSLSRVCTFTWSTFMKFEKRYPNHALMTTFLNNNQMRKLNLLYRLQIEHLHVEKLILKNEHQFTRTTMYAKSGRTWVDSDSRDFIYAFIDDIPIGYDFPRMLQELPMDMIMNYFWVVGTVKFPINIEVYRNLFKFHIINKGEALKSLLQVPTRMWETEDLHRIKLKTLIIHLVLELYDDHVFELMFNAIRDNSHNEKNRVMIDCLTKLKIYNPDLFDSLCVAHNDKLPYDPSECWHIEDDFTYCLSVCK